MQLSYEICSVWKNVGTWLGLPKHTLDNIAGTTQLDTPQKKGFEMLMKWRRLQPGSIAQSRHALAAALRHEGMEDLARRFTP